ncbi:unnamed protein product [Symbiodinium pilosum]|uniref:Uncharacterized protein n=1 Tax=Symbiodinium pilosum TaxID=2952 RepID=A0A812NUM0_SYMPI|nr:unnamed protein product [Symbiodinium pilosum]
MYTDFGGGVNWKEKESPLQGACRELAEELFAQDETTAEATARVLSEGIKSELLGGRPFVSRGYAMFVVSAEAIVSSLQIDPGDSAIDRLFESAKFFDSQGKANSELTSVALVNVGDFLRSAASDGFPRPLCTRYQEGDAGNKGRDEVIKLRPVMVGTKGSISVIHRVLADFASTFKEDSIEQKEFAVPASPYPHTTVRPTVVAGEGHAEQADSSVPKRRWQKDKAHIGTANLEFILTEAETL